MTYSATRVDLAQGSLNPAGLPRRRAPETLNENREIVLSVEDLHVEFTTSLGRVKAVDGISYSVRRGEIVALVGESGCGKSVSSLAIMRLLTQPIGRVTRGIIQLDGRNLLDLSEADMRHVRGRDISMIFQEPMTSLNPVLTIGLQLMEPLIAHLKMNELQARQRAIELLGLVGITDPERRLSQYPHQFSGGMRQRVMIAIGLACNPKVIIADEPTTALDVTIQAQILELMKDISRRLNVSLIIITHNLGLVARYADRVNIMYAGKIVEQGITSDIFSTPRHPYTIGLMKSVPRLDRPRSAKLETIEGLPPNLLHPPTGCRFAPRCKFKLETCEIQPALREITPGRFVRCVRAEEFGEKVHYSENAQLVPENLASENISQPLLSVTDLYKEFSVRSRKSIFSSEHASVKAVNCVSFDISRGETLGLVGESGCGKTTVGRLLLHLERSTSGSIRFDGHEITNLEPKTLRILRRRIQVIFQDPFASLNPRMSIGQIIAEPLGVFKLAKGRRAARDRVEELLKQVGLHAYMAERYPHQLSGGQRQRVGIARALAMEPDFIVCDEPVSALDVSVQGQIINLLEDLQATLSLTYLFIAHDLAVVRHISKRVAVMYLGRIVEMADRDELYANPRHPYTRALLEAAPIPDPEVERNRSTHVLKGELPSPLTPPSGCVFRTRCPLASRECSELVPDSRMISPKHMVACIKA